jgi:selenocysteine lyase/cysteine desulfurase
VLIDGAHALGSLDINMAEIDADYYVSNAHKWLACPKVSNGDVWIVILCGIAV